MIKDFKPSVDIQFSFILLEMMYKEFYKTYKNYPTVVFVGNGIYGTETWFKVNEWITEKLNIPIVLDYHRESFYVIMSDGMNRLDYKTTDGI